MLNKWIPLSLCQDAGIKLPSKVPRCGHRSHCARHSRVSRNFQSNVWNAPGHLHRMPRRGNNAWPRGSKGILFPALLLVSATPSRQRWLRRSGCVLEGTPLIRDIPIMDAGLKGHQVRGFDSRIRSADTFDLRAYSRFWILFHVAGDIKHRMGSIFVYSGILPRRVLPCGNDRVDFEPALLSLSLPSFSLLRCFFVSLVPILFP